MVVAGSQTHVTVLMAVYNGGHVVEAAIESILAQTYSDWDALLINDGSLDGTGRILESFSRRDSRIVVLQNPSNCGLAACMNTGWRQARGLLIARMDADDISLPERLEHQVLFMKSHPDVDVLGTGAEVVDESGRTLGVALRPEYHGELVRRMYKEAPFIHPSVMVRRNLFESLHGYDERLRRSQDTDLWLRAYRSSRFHNLQEPLIRYHMGRAPSFEAVCWGAYVLGRAAYREGRIHSRGWYALRYLAAGVLTKARIMESRLR